MTITILFPNLPQLVLWREELVPFLNRTFPTGRAAEWTEAQTSIDVENPRVELGNVVPSRRNYNFTDKTLLAERSEGMMSRVRECIAAGCLVEPGYKPQVSNNSAIYDETDLRRDLNQIKKLIKGTS
jgi:hypothetical protein